MKKLLMLLFASLIISCGSKDPLAGRTFLLSEPGLAITTILFQFSGNKEVEIIIMNDLNKSVNSYTKVPYRIEGDTFSFQGVSYKMENNNDDFNLYKNNVLKYRLSAVKEDLAGRLTASPLVKKSK